MFGEMNPTRIKAMIVLAVYLTAGAALLLPNAAFAQAYGGILSSPGQAQSRQTLRDPLIPGCAERRCLSIRDAGYATAGGQLL